MYEEKVKDLNIIYESVLHCDLCGSSRTKVLDEKGHIVQCRKCGLKFVSPRLKQEGISKAYDWSFENCPGWGKIRPEEELIYQRRFDFLERFIRGGKILDVGAGLGVFLSKAKETNRWQCFGTETSEYAVEFAKREFDIALSVGQLEDLGYPEKSFDVVTFWHVLEHLPYPSRAIGEARRILKDNGFIFIAVPNDSWLGRRHFFKNAIRRTINRLPIEKKLRLKKMYPEIDEGGGHKHLFHFTPHTLTKLLQKYDFRLRKGSIDYDYERPNPKIERRYRFNLLSCHLSGINLSNAILIAAQKKKVKRIVSQGQRLEEINKIAGHLGLNEGRLLFKITKSLKNNSVIVEIGAFKGKSSCFIAEGIGAKNCEFYTIDTWHNDGMKQQGDAYVDFLQNIEPYQDKIRPLRGFSYDVIKEWPKERKIDFLWIDGDHSYAGVKRDIQDWIPLVNTNGTVCFHDYRDAPGVRKAVDEIKANETIKLVKTEGCIFMGRRK